MMAFLWERRDGLSPAARAAVEAHLPVTRAPGGRRPARSCEAEQADWVLKSDYGCEGEEVIIGRAGRRRPSGAPAWRRPCPAAGSPSATSEARPDRRRRRRSTTASTWWPAAPPGLYARLSSGRDRRRRAVSAAVEVVP